MTSSRFHLVCAISLFALGACTDLDSTTNLNPEGPPMIRQVRMKEMYMDASGNLTERLTPVFAFGTHPKVASDDEAHPVTSAKAVNNKLRIIMDELLVGNYLEEIACRGTIDEDAYDFVPVGTTPDDIARCAVARDVLPQSCPKGFSKGVCMCKLEAGCGNAGEIKLGEPVGVLDVNQDGAADDTRFQRGAVGMQCSGIDVPIDINASYWNPSGDQNVPAMGGFDALGPAIVLVADLPPNAPMGMPAFLPTNTTCKLVFADSVVDKQGERVCAPPDGDITKPCTPGNVDAFSFKIEPLTATNTTFSNDDTGVSRTDPVTLKFSAPLDPAAINDITVTQGGTPYTQFTLSMPFTDTVRITWTGGLAATTQYTINIPTSVKDFYAQPLPMPSSYTFTTGM
jgi:hypothetical protein